jgi:TonB-linked SusC/RagA family outer membrane protein
MLNPDGTLTHSASYTVGDFYYGRNGFEMGRSVIRNTSGFTSSFFDDTFRVIGDFSFQHTNSDEFRRRVQVPYSKAPGVIEYVGTQYNDIRNTIDRTNYIATNLYGEYDNWFGENHYLKVMLGSNYEESTFQRLRAERNGLILEDGRDLNLALGQSILTGGGYEKWRIFGGFYRLNYIFGDRYLFEFNGRYDGSSKFPEDQRYAFFPSVSVGWRISQEPFWGIPHNIVSDLKLRASYGSLGNGSISSYAFLETFSISQSGRILNGIQPMRTSNPSVLPQGLTWETSTTRNFGMDLSMASGRLQFTGDMYVRETTDMYTIGMTLPATFGATSPRGNYADLRTTGWETMLAWRNRFSLVNRPFNYNIRVTLADYQAEILKYNNPDKFLNDYYEGMKMGEMWGFVTEGFFTSQEEIAAHADQSRYRSTSWGEIMPGDIKLRDVDGDGFITPGDNTYNNPGDRVIIGNTTPRYTFSLNLGGDWNNFFLSVFFQGVGKQDWYPRYESNIFWGQYNRPYGDIPKWHLNEGIIWSEENPNSFFPRYVSRLANRSGAILREQQSGYVMNAAYIRMKNLQFGYNLPSTLISRVGMRSARVYMTMDNFWTWSPLYRTVDNIDVENATAPSDQLFTSSNAGDGYNYPMLKSISLGLNVTF